MRVVARIGIYVCLALTLVCCSDNTSAESQPLLVSAASSLANAFTEIEMAFESRHPDIDVIINLAGSSALREQILEGAPVDVFASANLENMEQVVGAGMAGATPVAFAQNALVIAVPLGNPGGVTGLVDFSNEDLLIGLCAPGVPCGDFAREILSSANVVPAIDTNEPDVRSLLTKLEAGELDAGIVYVSDVSSSTGVDGIEIPAEVNVAAEYPIAVLADAPHRVAAEEFVAFVLSDVGAEILARNGFSVP